MFKSYLNQSLDAEVRIAAYLQVMRCPIYSVVRNIVAALDVEEVNQGIVDVVAISNKTYAVFFLFAFSRFICLHSFE